MGKIKKILENELIGGTQSTDVYPVTSIKAVFDTNNKSLDTILEETDVKFSELNAKTGVHEMVNSALSYGNNIATITLNDKIKFINIFSVKSMETNETIDFPLIYYFKYTEGGESEYMSVKPQDIIKGITLFLPEKPVKSIDFYTEVSNSSIFVIDYAAYYKDSSISNEIQTIVSNGVKTNTIGEWLKEIYNGGYISFFYTKERVWSDETRFLLRKGTTYYAKIKHANIPIKSCRFYRNDNKKRTLLCNLKTDSYSEFYIETDTSKLEVINENDSNINGVIELEVIDKLSLSLLQEKINDVIGDININKTDISSLKEITLNLEENLALKLENIPFNSVSEDMLTPTVREKLNGNITGLEQTLSPDDKDLTVLNSKIIFADKLNNGGFKYKYLRANTEGQYVINSSTFIEENCIYIIRDKYIVENDEEITLPQNSILLFKGGFIEGGTLIGNKSEIISYPQYILNTSIKGVWTNQWFADWFADCSVDASVAITKGLQNMALIGLSLRDNSSMIENVPELTFTAKEYICKSPINLRDIFKDFNVSPVVKLGGESGSTVIRSQVGFEEYSTTKYLFEYKKPNNLRTLGLNIYVNNIKFIADKFEDWHTPTNTGCFMLGGGGEIGEEYPEWINNCRFQNCSFKHFYQAINIEKAFWTRIISCDFFYCGNMLRLVNTNSSTLINNVFRGSYVKAVEIVNGTGMQITGNSFDQHLIACELHGRCDSISIIGNYFEAQSGDVQCNELILGNGESDNFTQLIIKANLGLLFTNAYNNNGIYYHKGIKVNGNFEYCDIDGVLDIVSITGKKNKGIVSVFGTDSINKLNGIFENIIKIDVKYT